MKRLILIALTLIATQMYSQIELTDDNAESKLLVNDDTLIVVDFYATWCGPCKMMDPIFKELVQEYGGKVNFYKIDVDKSKVDDALGVTAMPTYFFIKNSKNLEVAKGAMSKSDMKKLIDNHLGSDIIEASSSTPSSNSPHGATGEFSQSAIDAIWNDYSKLNTLAWHAYEEHGEIDILLKAIKIVERSIELNENFHNLDTHAALLYKTGNYTKALKIAKKAIDIAKKDGLDYEVTSELINKIIDKM